MKWWMLMLLAVAFGPPSLMLAAVACGPPPNPNPPIPPTEACELASENLQRLQCRDDIGQPTWSPTFTETCKWFEKQGLYMGQHCLAVVDSCDEVEAATRAQVGDQCP